MKKNLLFGLIMAMIILLASCSTTTATSNKNDVITEDEVQPNRIFLSALPASYYPGYEEKNNSYVTISSGQKKASAYRINTAEIKKTDDTWILDVSSDDFTVSKPAGMQGPGFSDYSTNPGTDKGQDFTYSAKSDNDSISSTSVSRTITFTEDGPVINPSDTVEKQKNLTTQEDNTDKAENNTVYTQFPDYNIPARESGSTIVNQSIINADFHDSQGSVIESERESYDTSAYNKAIEQARNANIITNNVESFLRKNLALIAVLAMGILFVVVVLIINRSFNKKKEDDGPDYWDTYEEIEDTKSEITDSIGKQDDKSEGER